MFSTDWGLPTRLREFIECDLCGTYYTIKLSAYLLQKAISITAFYFQDLPHPNLLFDVSVFDSGIIL